MTLRTGTAVLLSVPALDDHHSHQAAPGRDPMDLRPGATESDPNHMHTAAPGQPPAGGVAGDPARGCPDDPRG